MSNILEYEPLLDKAINSFVQKLGHNFADIDVVCDLDKLLLLCERHLDEELDFLYF